MNQNTLQACDRTLSPAEADLIAICLASEEVAPGYRAQQATLRVVRMAAEGVPEIHFAIPDGDAMERQEMTVLADFYYRMGEGVAGFFLFAHGDFIAGAKCWSMDGVSRPNAWPAPSELHRVGFPALADWARPG